eukprot:CAMPEP_0170363824 /NCGR_PEP_ID=MMETSP0117_2-20130122/5056_1 /TAXON_ID=400756 /ORGANISM="Durinskia baltica, Strain CSIRO CS-38" /LENGTH=82 /DNA_ID=CAMNT_0010618303 /DNA_START=624 /DNA_END=872 /DNA_ORIENTATION=-
MNFSKSPAATRFPAAKSLLNLFWIRFATSSDSPHVFRRVSAWCSRTTRSTLNKANKFSLPSPEGFSFGIFWTAADSTSGGGV